MRLCRRSLVAGGRPEHACVPVLLGRGSRGGRRGRSRRGGCRGAALRLLRFFFFVCCRYSCRDKGQGRRRQARRGPLPQEGREVQPGGLRGGSCAGVCSGGRRGEDEGSDGRGFRIAVTSFVVAQGRRALGRRLFAQGSPSAALLLVLFVLRFFSDRGRNRETRGGGEGAPRRRRRLPRPSDGGGCGGAEQRRRFRRRRPLPPPRRGRPPGALASFSGCSRGR